MEKTLLRITPHLRNGCAICIIQDDFDLYFLICLPKIGRYNELLIRQYKYLTINLNIIIRVQQNIYCYIYKQHLDITKYLILHQMNVSSFDRQKGLIHPEGCIPFEPNHYEPQNVKVYVEKLFLYYVLLSILYYCVIASTVFWS